MVSGVAALIAGTLIMIMWIVAAHDRGEEDGSKYKCRGCIYYYHDDLWNGSGPLNDWYRVHRDSYVIMISFGVICGLFWWIAGALAFMANSEMMAKLNIIVGVVTYTIFVVLFAVIADRLKYSIGCAARCSMSDNWFIKHSMDSIHEFSGCSLACFILGAFHIIGGIYTYATLTPLPQQK